jgi:hypothetical protein
MTDHQYGTINLCNYAWWLLEDLDEITLMIDEN